ncbi:hypothetical protein LINPERPRIM_LOCUS20281, partial [Linum perenne]
EEEPIIVNWASTRTLPSRQSKVPYSLTRPADIYSSVIVLQFTLQRRGNIVAGTNGYSRRLACD